jgi:hypothetical protein
MSTSKMRAIATISSRGKGASALRKSLKVTATSTCDFRRFPGNPHGKFRAFLLQNSMF